MGKVKKLSLEGSYKWMLEKKVAFGILDTSSNSKNDLATSISKNIMEYWVEEICQSMPDKEIIKISQSPDNLLRWALENGFEYILISGLGATYKNSGKNFFDQLQDFFNHDSKITLIGSFINRHADYYELDKSAFLINLNWWNKKGRPFIGESHDIHKKYLPKVSRSVKKHTDGSPVWLERKNQETTIVSRSHFGWHIIAKALEDGEKIYSWYDNLLKAKNIINIENQESSFYKMNLVFKQLQSNIHFIANTEDSHKLSTEAGNFDAVVCTAGGFTPMIRAWRTNINEQGSVIIIDTSHLALKFSREIVDGFLNKKIDIFNFESTLKDMMTNYMPDDKRNTIYDRDIFNGQDNIKPMQLVCTEFANVGLAEYIEKKLPTLNFTWILEDLFNVHESSDRIISKTKNNDRVLLNFSNVYSYYNTSLFYSFKTKRFLYKDLLMKLHNHNKNKFWVQDESNVLSLEQAINVSKQHEQRINSIIEWKK